MAIGIDRVQALKQESAGNGGDSADDTVYPAPIQPQEDALEAAGLFLQDENNRDEAVYIERAGNNLRFVDVSNPSGFSLSQLAAGGAGLTEGQHQALDTLVHLVAEDADIELERTGGRVTRITVWTDSGRTTKIRETTIARTSGQVSTIVTKQYDIAGVLSATMTDTVSRTSGQITTIGRVVT